MNSRYGWGLLSSSDAKTLTVEFGAETLYHVYMPISRPVCGGTVLRWTVRGACFRFATYVAIDALEYVFHLCHCAWIFQVYILPVVFTQVALQDVHQLFVTWDWDWHTIREREAPQIWR